MLRALLALSLAAASASAQVADPAPPAPNRLVLGLAGVGASTATLVAFGTASPDLAAAGLLLSPVAAATAVYAVGQAQGGDDSFGRTLGNAALGTLPAVALLTATTLVLVGSGWDTEADDSGAATGALGIAAGAAFVVGPGAYAAFRYREPRALAASPTVVLARMPDGTLVPIARWAVGL